MKIRWHGQSAYTLTGAEHTVAIDPFGDMGPLLGSRLRFAYPPVPEHDAQLLLVTHEHRDHNGVEAITGDPQVVRSTAGRFETPVGEVVAIASEHDAEAGTSRGPNTIFVFTLDGVRVCHFGDFGQTALRPEQRAAIGPVDLVFLPVGGGPTIGADQAAEITRTLCRGSPIRLSGADTGKPAPFAPELTVGCAPSNDAALGSLRSMTLAESAPGTVSCESETAP